MIARRDDHHCAPLHIEPYNLRVRGEGREVLAPAPGGKMLPVRGAGTAGIGRARRLDIGAGAIGEEG